MNFTRPQVYISKKEDVEELKRDFEEGGYDNLSDYFKELIMFGYDAKRKEGTVSVMAEMKKIRKSIVSIEDDVSFLKKCVYELYVGMERMERLAEEYPISNELIEPEDGIVDVKALDYIMEIGMLVKILQAGLIDENAFAKAKENVSKRYGNHHSFWNKRHVKVNMFLKKTAAKL